MGYQVYPQGSRWAGYGVPAECDQEGCGREINRGLGYMCGEGFSEPDEYGYEDTRGCDMFFCEDHRYEHDCGNVVGKPDSLEWEAFMLTDESWELWRAENPAKVEAMRERAATNNER